jgi:hypothetical protein
MAVPSGEAAGFFPRRLKKQKPPTAKIAITAIPPTTPPTMAPIGAPPLSSLELELVSAVELPVRVASAAPAAAVPLSASLLESLLESLLVSLSLSGIGAARV